ncbi:kinase-like domain-containing protein [Lipomyces tetrasporus]
MYFDFDAYLAQIDPFHIWSVQRISGGLVNFTVRAYKVSSSAQDTIQKGLFDDYETLILKFAPPYIAALGESAPFSQVRQIVEANALSLFTPPLGPFISLAQDSSVVVPKLLQHDAENHILILEDLGNLPTLSEYLTPLSKRRQSQSDIAILHQIGWRLGQFLADLHSKSALDTLGTKTLKGFENPSMVKVVRESAVSPIVKYLEKFDIQDAEQLVQVVTEDFDRDLLDEEKCFTVGDLWTGAILISEADFNGDVITTNEQVQSDVDGNEPKLGVIDWEFSGAGAGVNGDMAQLFAHLHLHLLAAEQGSQLHDITAGLIESIADSYNQRSRLKRAIWTLTDTGQRESLSISIAPEESSPAARIMRSAFVLHGRELVNNAIERDWTAFSGTSGKREANLMVRSMVLTGVWYLRAAKKSVVEFVSAENWKHMCSAKEGSIMMRLLTGI